MFNLTSLAWVFFRAADVSTAMFILTRITTAFTAPASASILGLDALNFWISLGLALALLPVEALGRQRSVWAVIDGRPRWQRWTAYYVFTVAFVGLALTAPAHTPTPFIYFQF